MTRARRRVVVLGGSFDPVHEGHLALGRYFAELLDADELRVIPAGNPWQKHGLQASAEDRVAMVRIAFAGMPVPVTIDCQEIERDRPSFTIETLRALRQEYGPEASIAFLIGADQLLHLDSWQEWRAMFDHAHLCAASRPGFALDDALVPVSVRAEFARRSGSVAQLAAQPHGLSYLASDLAVDISATSIRARLQHGDVPGKLVPTGVLDYIERYNLYKRS